MGAYTFLVAFLASSFGVFVPALILSPLAAPLLTLLATLWTALWTVLYVTLLAAPLAVLWTALLAASCAGLTYTMWGNEGMPRLVFTDGTKSDNKKRFAPGRKGANYLRLNLVEKLDAPPSDSFVMHLIFDGYYWKSNWLSPSYLLTVTAESIGGAFRCYWAYKPNNGLYAAPSEWFPFNILIEHDGCSYRGICIPVEGVDDLQTAINAALLLRNQPPVTLCYRVTWYTGTKNNLVSHDGYIVFTVNFNDE